MVIYSLIFKKVIMTVRVIIYWILINSGYVIRSSFQDLTGIEDIALCRDVLQRHNWDLETAVQDQLNIKEGRPSVYSVSRPSSNDLPVVYNDPSLQQVFIAESPRLPFRWRWTGTFGFIASLLFKFVYNTFTSLLEFARNFFWNRPRYRK